FGSGGREALLWVWTPPCGSADFDCDGDVGTDADIEWFFRCLAGECPAGCGSSADFNMGGDGGTDGDGGWFLRVLGAGDLGVWWWGGGGVWGGGGGGGGGGAGGGEGGARSSIGMGTWGRTRI